MPRPLNNGPTSGSVRRIGGGDAAIRLPPKAVAALDTPLDDKDNPFNDDDDAPTDVLQLGNSSTWSLEQS